MAAEAEATETMRREQCYGSHLSRAFMFAPLDFPIGATHIEQTGSNLREQISVTLRT